MKSCCPAATGVKVGVGEGEFAPQFERFKYATRSTLSCNEVFSVDIGATFIHCATAGYKRLVPVSIG